MDFQIIKRFSQFVGAVLVAAGLLSCMGPSISTPHVIVPVPTSVVRPTGAQPTAITTQVLTKIASPIMATSAPAITVVPTVMALTQEEALAYIISTQETNGGCELPCWWGITPGETTGESAKRLLAPLRDFMQFYIGYRGGSEAEYELQFDKYNNLRVELNMADQQRAIENITIFSFIPNEDRTRRYHESWRRYFLNDMLSRLGKPSRVWLGFGRSTAEKDSPYFYELYLIYSDLNIIARYMGPATHDSINRACPLLEQLKDLHIDIWDSKVRLEGPTGELFTEAKPIEKVSRLSLESFYEMFTGPTRGGCIDSPATLWP